MKSPKARTAVRTGRTERWEIDRLLALVAGLGMKAEIRLVALDEPVASLQPVGCNNS
jgi:hypothetical protein